MVAKNDGTSVTVVAEAAPSAVVAPLCAVLDLGSNSFHLVIGRVEDGRIIIVDRRKDMVRLAEGLRDDGCIDKTVMERALASLDVFAQQVQQLDRHRVRVVGTNTLRAASNGDEFLERAEAVIGVPIDIVSGREEGRLIFLGVSRAFPSSNVRRLVIDIGGGSTELIIGKKRATRIESLFMGCVSYSERFFRKNKISSRYYYQRALTAARAELRPLVGRFGSDRWSEAVGSSGTIRNVEAVIDRLHPCGHVITLDGIERIVTELDRNENPGDLSGLSENRAPVFSGGVAILHAAFLELGIEELHVSDYALKEGVLYELAECDLHEDTRRQTIEYLVRQFHIDRQHAGVVERFALALLPGLLKALIVDTDFARHTLSAAARLHELGLTVSHSGYHKHGAYLLENADMPGFSRRDQKLLSFLVLNHRRKLRVPAASYSFKPDWALVLILRLACLFNRGRIDDSSPPMPEVSAGDKLWRLEIDPEWLATRPLLEEDLVQEAGYWRSQGYRLQLNDSKL